MTKINPVSNEEQEYPSTNQEIEALRTWDVTLSKTEQINALTNKHYSTAFAIINTELTYDKLPTTEVHEKRDQLARDLDRVNTQGKIPDISLWISELIQNALDSTWGDGVGASKVELDFSETSFTFSHDGRPPQYLGFNKNEIQSMIQSGSTKRADLSKEGRFGIGFKYWTYYFEEVTLSSSGWEISWDKSLELKEKPMQIDAVDTGMKLKFTNPIFKHAGREFTPYTDLAAEPENIINDGMIRLVKGLALQPTPMNVVVRSNHEEIFNFSHEVEMRDFDHPGLSTPLRYTLITNEITTKEDGTQTILVPTKLVGVDISQLYQSLSSTGSTDQSNLNEVRAAHDQITGALKQEFANHDLPSVRQILERYAEDTGMEWNVEENKDHAAEEEALKVRSMCLFDLSAEPIDHFLLSSLFPVSHRWHNGNIVRTTGHTSRVYFVGSYHTNEDRTSLSDRELRNLGILYAQFVSYNLLMSLAALTEFREKVGISPSLHRELLLSDSWVRDHEFANCINHENALIVLEKFTSFAAWPVIRRAGEVISQEYVPLGKVVRLRQYFEKFLQSEDTSVRTWAQNIVEPDECCIYTTSTEGENEISEWIPCSPYLAPLSEESFRPRLMESDVPESSLTSKIQNTINSKKIEWPEWLPIPLSEIVADSKKWYTPDQCQNFVILGGESSEDEDQEWPDNFTSSVHEESVKEGMKSYRIVDGFSLPEDKKIHGLKIEDTGKGRLFQLSIDYLREKRDEFAEYITDLLEKKAQNHDYWPVFCHSSSDELLMIHEPKLHWKQTFICMNDVFEGHDKSLWSTRRNNFFPIHDALQSDVNDTEVGRYIENLSDPAKKNYTHIIFEEQGGAWCDAFSALKSWTPVRADDVPKFSECSYHYINSSTQNRNKPMAFVNVQAAVWPGDTSEEFKKKRRKKIPPLPNVLRALHLPSEFKQHIQCFRPYGNRKDFQNMYEMNASNSTGFFRHVFNLINIRQDDSEQFNNNQSQSHIERSPLERNMFNNMEDDERLQAYWRSALENFESPMSRNYAFMFHILSPSAYAMERLIGDDQSSLKLNNALILSSFEGLHREIFNMPAGQRSYSPYFCAITKGEGNKQRLVIEKAKLGRFSQTSGTLTDISTLSENMFNDYKPKYVGFNSDEDEGFKFFEVPLFGAVGQRAGTQENEYLPGLWSPRVADSAHDEGLMARMLLEATKQQGTLPFTELGFGEHYQHGGLERTKANQDLMRSLERGFWEHESESLAFKWFFHPRGRAINTLMLELVRNASSEESTGILTIVEGLYYRALSLYPEDTELLKSRLRQWFPHHRPEWASVITADFSTAIKEALEGAEKKTLLEGFKDCSTFQEVFDEIKNHPHHVMRHTSSTLNWKQAEIAQTNQIREQSRLIITESSSIFGKVERNETYNAGTGFGLLANHFWCPLRGEEINYLTTYIPNSVDREFDWEFVASGFTNELQQAFESQSEALSLTPPDGSLGDEQEEVDEQFSFLQDVVDWMYLHTLSSMGQLNSAGDRAMHIRPRVQIDYQSPNTGVAFGDGGMDGVTLGPAGWNVSYEDGTLTFSTSSPKSKENFQNKIQMLESLLTRVMDKDELYRSSIRLSEIDTNRIRNEFSINHPSSTRSNPLKDFEGWYDFYCSDLVEPDQDFLAYHDGGDWRERVSAESLLTALESNIPTWLEQEYATKTEWKAELVKMYGNGMTCTLHDFRQPRLSDQMAGDMDRLMKVIRLHSGQGNNPTGVLDENQARLNQIGKKFKHLGNSLLVSSNAEHLGSRLNGWRLVAPPGHEGLSFLSYLDNHWQDLAYHDAVLDLEHIILDEVVQQPDDDDIHDRRGSIVLHKLHMLYILSYHKATLAVHEEEE